MPAKGDRPAGLCLSGKPVNRHHRETGPQDLVAAARAAGVTDPRVLEAIRRTPRVAFVPAAYATRACDDAPIPIPRQQVTTQPSLSAAMIAALGLTGTEEVFEVGTGYGYQTALLARLAARVVSIDIWPDPRHGTTPGDRHAHHASRRTGTVQGHKVTSCAPLSPRRVSSTPAAGTTRISRAGACPASAVRYRSAREAWRKVPQRYLPERAAVTVICTEALPSVACRAVTVIWPVLPGTDRMNAPPTPP